MNPEILEFIQSCIQKRKLHWTYHINMRMKERSISRDTIIHSWPDYEIIEAYPQDKYFPSYLVCSVYQHQIFHVLFAVDQAGDNCRIVTAYYPTPEEWDTDLKTRRKKP